MSILGQLEICLFYASRVKSRDVTMTKKKHAEGFKTPALRITTMMTPSAMSANLNSWVMS